jgi:hypothetical protein
MGITSLVQHLEVPTEVVQEVVDFLFHSKRWHENVEIVHDRVRRWRQAIRAASHATTVAPTLPPSAAMVDAARYPWIPQAVALRAEGRSWRATARAVGAAEPTVRRMVNRAAGVAA